MHEHGFALPEWFDPSDRGEQCLSRSWEDFPKIFECVKSKFVLSLHTMYRNFEDFESGPNQADENVHMIDNALAKAMAADVHKEDRRELRNVPPRRVLEVLREPLSATTVSDLLAAESQTFSVAATPLGMYGTEEFLKLMSVWCVIVWRIGITAHVYRVVLALDKFGCAARRRSQDDLVVARQTVLRQAAAARDILGDNTKCVSSHTFMKSSLVDGKPSRRGPQAK